MKKIFLTLLLTYSCSAFAGQNCEGKALQSDIVVDALTFTDKVINRLDRDFPNEDQVVLLGRIGQDISKYNQKYSHGGFAYRENGHWVVKHELNKCNTDHSSVYAEGIANFFLDDMYKYEAMIISFKEPYNTQLLNILKDNDLAVKMHGAKYNMLAYPFSTKYQNSNGYLIETFIFSISEILNKQISSRKDAQAALKEIDYKPTVLKIGPLTRLGGRITKANIAFDDHPIDDRVAGNIPIVTFDGMVKFFEEQNYINKKIELSE